MSIREILDPIICHLQWKLEENQIKSRKSLKGRWHPKSKKLIKGESTQKGRKVHKITKKYKIKKTH